MVVLYLLKNTGYLSVILSGAIRALSTDLRDSYILDSNSETGYVLYILLPQLKGTLLFLRDSSNHELLPDVPRYLRFVWQ